MKILEGTMILTSPMDYESVCINGTTVQFLSGITLAVSTVNIFIFLFDLYVKYEIMSYESSHDPSKTKFVEHVESQQDDDDEDDEDDGEGQQDHENNDDNDESQQDDEDEDEDVESQQDDEDEDEDVESQQDEELDTQSEPIKNVINEHIVV